MFEENKLQSAVILEITRQVLKQIETYIESAHTDTPEYRLYKEILKLNMEYFEGKK